MAEFKDSMQMKHWLLTQAEITSRREASHSRAVVARAEQPQSALVSLDEEAQLRRFHERRILRFIHAIQFPDKTAATAITYFKRFFLDHSVMDFNPNAIALSSIYAALKVEETLMTADDLVARFDVVMNGVDPATDVAEVPLSRDGTCERVTSAVLLNTELAFLQQIHFHLICYHPFRSLGIMREVLNNASIFGDGDVEMNDSEGKSDSGEKRLAEVIARAHYIACRRVLLSDLSLSRPPAVLAIAVIVVAMAELENGPSTEDVLHAVQNGSETKTPLDDELVSKINATVEQLEKLQDRAPDGEATTIASLEKKRRRVQTAENFLTTCLKEEEEAMNLEEVDQEEAQRSRAAREKTAKLLGFDTVNGDTNPAREKHLHDAAQPIEDMDSTPRKRQKLVS